MCAISGIINHHSDREAVVAVMRSMLEAQAHRGPDDEGIFCDSEVVLGHRRLSVIDIATGHQPIGSEDGRVIVVLNGEIYNFRELRAGLEARGHRFSTSSDTEVIVHLYEETGSELLALLDGMFAFALYDQRRRKLLLGRDRLGQKPLLYFMDRDTLVFASEFSGLRCHPGIPRELDLNAVSDYLSLQYIPGPGTVYRRVRKLPPGHLLEFNLQDSTLSIRAYWHLMYSLKPEHLSFDDAALELRRLVERAVEKRLVADVPLGVFLSGGIDSTIIASVAARLLAPSQCDAFTIGFAEESYDERAYARIAAGAINRLCGDRLVHHEQVVDPCDFSLLEHLVSRVGEPYADASLLPTALLSRFARSRITVALSGDGADELFSGYERYTAMRISGIFDALPGFLRRALFLVPSLCFADSGERTFSGRLRRLLRLLGDASPDRYFHLIDRCPGAVKSEIFGERMRETLRRDSAELFRALRWELSAGNPVEELSELDVHTYLPDDILTKVDIASMDNALEVRSPFLDREVVEFAARLPQEFKQTWRDRKHILKAAFADILPPELVKRPKLGFGAPVSSWLRGAWREEAEVRIFGSRLFEAGYLRREPLERRWRRHLERRADYGYLFWSLLILSIYFQQNPEEL